MSLENDIHWAVLSARTNGKFFEDVVEMLREEWAQVLAEEIKNVQEKK